MNNTHAKHILVAGGTGLVGSRLCQALQQAGYQVSILSRRQGSAPGGIPLLSWSSLDQAILSAHAVINLAGEGIADKRWSDRRKADILSSRTETTARIVEAYRQAGDRRPGILVNASAIGIYGSRDGSPIDETSEVGQGYLAEVCRAWETAADPVTSLGVRLAKVRIGIVLAQSGGALPKMSLPVRFFQGAKLGDGQQGFSWIHIDDLVSILIQCLENDRYQGVLNATSPFPTTNETFTRLLGKQLRRPILPVPAFVTRLTLRLLMGEMADAMLLKGAFVYPKALQSLGFRFKFERPEAALKELLG
ncbi:MAG: TIGR01777 family oxidoreductase [Holophagaceae bacterium]|jgi:uncharacterized protein (TIGR01777 family)